VKANFFYPNARHGSSTTKHVKKKQNFTFVVVNLDGKRWHKHLIFGCAGSNQQF
jgi:hypothetical protein